MNFSKDILINFYYHDPGTKNHLLPIYNELSKKYKTNFINLKDESQIITEPKISIGIYGLSTNKIELFHQSNDKIRIIYIESLIGNRLEKVSELNFDYIFVAENKCYQDMKGRFNNPIFLVGDTHYNYLNQKSVKKSYQKKYYTIFLSPDDYVMDSELCNFENFTSLIYTMEKLTPEENIILVKFHPRSSNNLIDHVKNLVKNNNKFLIDQQNNNYDIIKSSKLTFSIGSTTSFESMILGAPSTFVNLNSTFKNLHNLYDTDLISICKNEDDLVEFIRNPKINNNFINLHTNSIKKAVSKIENILCSKLL